MDGTVLVADDDRTIRTVLTQALTRAGCKVHATSSLVTLMRWVEEGKGDLVISDVVMPDGNGIEALPKIAAERPGRIPARPGFPSHRRRWRVRPPRTGVRRCWPHRGP